MLKIYCMCTLYFGQRMCRATFSMRVITIYAWGSLTSLKRDWSPTNRTRTCFLTSLSRFQEVGNSELEMTTFGHFQGTTDVFLIVSISFVVPAFFALCNFFLYQCWQLFLLLTRDLISSFLWARLTPHHVYGKMLFDKTCGTGQSSRSSVNPSLDFLPST